MKISIPNLIIEFVSVVFAVLLALGLNAYKQSLDNEATATALKEAIISECHQNYLKTDSLLTNNSEYSVLLDSLVQLDSEDIPYVPFFYHFELLTHGAWEAAQRSNAVQDLDPQFLLDAADIYHTQQFYTDFAASFFSNVGTFLAHQNSLDQSNMALAMYYYTGVLNNSVDDLRLKYEEFLDKYESN
ncbi:hypothetical protein [Marinoscillum furvescens]|uniref:Uncharacterized protein n=1 Tax=Marinoscillum furvescens DSM 4134 TaxID=1122208 RepID=A0A3D9L8H7_MARFU|nr:hypothetical protein [Marinoscillum furvescens]REE02140.1 hypothetical protein C7460_102164 [Marinoscillum furvescens DSM 4134]